MIYARLERLTRGVIHVDGCVCRIIIIIPETIPVRILDHRQLLRNHARETKI